MIATEKETRRSFVNSYPITSFFILALALGAATMYLVVQRVLPADLALSSALSASIAGIIMTAVEDGRAGLKLMLNRLLIWRVGIGYWIFALLFLIPAILLGSKFNPFFNGDPISFSNMKPASCVIRAILGGIWHLPLLIYSGLQPSAFANFPYGGWIAQNGFLVAFITMNLMFLLPWSIFLTWIFNNTKGSLLLVAILHGSEIWVAYWMLSFGISPSNLDDYWGYGAVMVLTAIIIVIITGSQNLSRKHKRIVYQQMLG
jgi:hypothetical protein